MSVAREVYRVTLEPGRDVEPAVAKLAKYIIDRWMPGHAGGAVMAAGPNLCALLHPIWCRANALGRAIVLEVDTRGNRVAINEVPA